MVAIGWSAWVFVLVGLLYERRMRGPWTGGMMLLFAASGLLSQVICLGTLVSVLDDPGAGRVLLIGSGVGAIALIGIVVLVRLMDSRTTEPP